MIAWSTKASALGAIAAVLVLLVAAPVGAVTSVTTGWWTTAVTPVAPDVPPDGLLVQSVGTPTAYAALSFELGDGEQPATLTLRPAPSTFSNPATTLRLCPLTETFEPAQGGTADDAPAYDCTAAIDAAPTSGTYTFDVSALPATTILSVAVLPTGPLDRVVLAAPDLDALTTTNPTTGTTEPVDVPSTTVPSASTGAPSSPSRPGPVIPRTTPVIGGAGSAPSAGASGQQPSAAVQDATAPPLPAITPSAATTSRLAQLALATTVAACVILWLASSTFADRRARRDRDTLVAST